MKTYNQNRLNLLKQKEKESDQFEKRFKECCNFFFPLIRKYGWDNLPPMKVLLIDFNKQLKDQGLKEIGNSTFYHYFDRIKNPINYKRRKTKLNPIKVVSRKKGNVLKKRGKKIKLSDFIKQKETQLQKEFRSKIKEKEKQIRAGRLKGSIKGAESTRKKFQ